MDPRPPTTPLEVPDQLTPVSTPEFVDAVRAAYAQLTNNSSLDDFQLATLWGHFALETGNGASVHNFNPGNFKWTPSWSGPYHLLWTGTNDGTPNHEGWQRYRAFSSLAAGVYDWLSSIKRGYLQAWNAIVTSSDSLESLAKAYAGALVDGGYLGLHPTQASRDQYTNGVWGRAQAFMKPAAAWNPPIPAVFVPPLAATSHSFWGTVALLGLAGGLLYVYAKRKEPAHDV